MAMVKVWNRSQDLVMVGERYLLPGEGREVLASVAERHSGDKRLLCVLDDAPQPSPEGGEGADDDEGEDGEGALAGDDGRPTTDDGVGDEAGAEAGATADGEDDCEG